MSPAHRSAAAAGFQNFVEIGVGRFEGRNDAEDNPGQKRDRQGEKENARVKGKINRAIRKKWRAEGPEQFTAPVGDEKTGDAAYEGEQSAFREELADEARTTGAESGAQSKFFFAFGGLREKEIREVHAGDEQHEADYAHEDATGERELGPLVDAEGGLVERVELAGAARVIARIFLFESGGDGLHGGACLIDGDVGFEPADDGDPAHAAMILECLELTRDDVVAHAEGNPEYVWRSERDDAFEIGGSDADDGVRRGVQGDGLTDDVRVRAKTARPESVAEDGERVAADFLAFVGIEEAAAIGLYAKNVEEIRADHGGLELLRLGLASPIERKGEGDGGQAGKDRVLIAIVLVVGKGGGRKLEIDVGVDGLGVASENFREPSGFLDRKRVEEDGVDDGEDGGVGADAESERKNGDKGEARAFLEHTEAAAQVLTKSSGHLGTSRAHGLDS